MADFPLKIAVTDCRDFAKYSRWLEEFGRSEPRQAGEQGGSESHPEHLEIVRLFYRRGNAEAVRECSGLVLTGGEAVNPAMYGKAEWIDLIDPSQLDDYRDLFEIQVLERALAEPIPILAVGRGMHLFNVFLGGSLRFEVAEGAYEPRFRSEVTVERSPDAKLPAPIAGLLEPFPTVVHRTSGSVEHEIEVSPGTLLETVLAPELKERKCIVNSDHHQAIDRIASELIASAYTADGVVEALEWLPRELLATEPDLSAHSDVAKPWLLGLQCQLERMETPVAKLVREKFIEACKERAEHRRTGFSRA